MELISYGELNAAGRLEARCLQCGGRVEIEQDARGTIRAACYGCKKMVPAEPLLEAMNRNGATPAKEPDKEKVVKVTNIETLTKREPDSGATGWPAALSQTHREQLEASGISAMIATERGYRSAEKNDLAALGFAEYQRRRGLLIPLHNVHGEVAGHVLRPDDPRTRTNQQGKTTAIKYDHAAGGAQILDVPPICQRFLGDPEVPLWLTEGAKKADAGISAGSELLRCIISLSGVYGWRGKNGDGGTTVLADFESLALKNRTVYLAFDSDAAANMNVKRALERFAAFLTSRGARVKIIRLDPRPNGAKTGLDDYLAGGGRLEDLTGQADEPQAQPAADEDSIDPSGDVIAMAAKAWRAFERVNGDRPRFFRSRNCPARLERDDEGALFISQLTLARLGHELARIISFSKDGTPAKVPQALLDDMLARPDIPLPICHRIITAPFFDVGGNLILEPGYHASARTYFDARHLGTLPAMAPKPTPQDIVRARDLIEREVLGEFPFVPPAKEGTITSADKAHAIALMILPTVRAMIEGPSPLHNIESATPATGKGLLAQVLTNPTMGDALATLGDVPKDEEFEKKLVSILMRGRDHVLFDNVRRPVVSGALARAITSLRVEDRLLGGNEMLSADMRLIWVMTANNPTFSDEMARRMIRIRLVSEHEHPEERTGFQHPDLLAWVKANRRDLLWAILTLVQNWIAFGRPKPAVKPLGSFESWTEVMGGILQAAGISGFLENRLEATTLADDRGGAWRQLFAVWYQQYGQSEMFAREVFPLTEKIDGLRFGKSDSERSQQTAFGAALARQRDRVYSLKLDDDTRVTVQLTQTMTSKHAARWRLVNLVNLRDGDGNNVVSDVIAVKTGEPVTTGEPGEP